MKGFPGLDGGFENPKAENDPNVFVSIRRWSKELMKPISLRDVVFPKANTVAQFKYKHPPNFASFAANFPFFPPLLF